MLVKRCAFLVAAKTLAAALDLGIHTSAVSVPAEPGSRAALLGITAAPLETGPPGNQSREYRRRALMAFFRAASVVDARHVRTGDRAAKELYLVYFANVIRDC